LRSLAISQVKFILRHNITDNPCLSRIRYIFKCILMVYLHETETKTGPIFKCILMAYLHATETRTGPIFTNVFLSHICVKLKLGVDLSLNIFLWHISVKLKLVLDLSLNVFLWHISIWNWTFVAMIMIVPQSITIVVFYKLYRGSMS